MSEFARALDAAWAHAEAIPAPTSLDPSLTIGDAYAIQDLVIEQRVANGRRVVGWKLGLTSADPPATPIVGTLLDDMVLSSGSELSVPTMVAPMVEAEIVIRMGETISRPITVADLQQGPHRIGPGIEVIDYRTTNSVGEIDWVADNSTVAFAVVGALVPVGDPDPRDVEAALYLDDTHLASGRGEMVMGNPLAAVAWLAGHLAERARPLQRDDVILTGSLTGHHRVPREGGRVTADFGPLGSVSVGFLADGSS